MLSAFLTDRTTLTPAKIRKRIMAGAPIYGTNPDRPYDTPRRVPFRELSPEAWASLAVRPQQAGEATRYVQDKTGAVYAQTQALLVLWRKAGGPCDPPDFGEQASDVSGNATPRTESAIRSFQRWTNANGGDVREDGVLDQATLGALLIVTADAARTAQKPKTNVVPWVLAGGAAALFVLWNEYNNPRGR